MHVRAAQLFAPAGAQTCQGKLLRADEEPAGCLQALDRCRKLRAHWLERANHSDGAGQGHLEHHATLAAAGDAVPAWRVGARAAGDGRCVVGSDHLIGEASGSGPQDAHDSAPPAGTTRPRPHLHSLAPTVPVFCLCSCTPPTSRRRCCRPLRMVRRSRSRWSSSTAASRTRAKARVAHQLRPTSSTFATGCRRRSGCASRRPRRRAPRRSAASRWPSCMSSSPSGSASSTSLSTPLRQHR